MVFAVIRTGMNTLFSKYLFVTNTLTASALLGLGDGIEQARERRRGESKKHDWKRTGKNSGGGSSGDYS